MGCIKADRSSSPVYRDDLPTTKSKDIVHNTVFHKYSDAAPESQIREIGKNLDSDSRFGFGFIIFKDSDSRFEIRLRIIFLDSDSRFGERFCLIRFGFEIRPESRILSNLRFGFFVNLLIMARKKYYVVNYFLVHSEKSTNRIFRFGFGKIRVIFQIRIRDSDSVYKNIQIRIRDSRFGFHLKIQDSDSRFGFGVCKYLDSDSRFGRILRICKC